jgi:hypothetical protein
MSSSNVSPNPEITTITFPSLTALRVAHNDLLKQHRRVQDEELSEQLRGETEAFIHQGKATGALLDSEDDRWAAQSLLDYWTSVLSRSGYKPPEVTLADFDLSLAPKLDDSLRPYLGLEAFREKDRQFFYGRKRLLEQLLQKFQESRLLS